MKGKMWLIVGAIMLAAIGCGGGASGNALSERRPTPTPPATEEVEGVLHLYGEWPGEVSVRAGLKIGDECYGSERYRDIAEGAQLRLRDEQGTILATGTLERGQLANKARAFVNNQCSFPFTIADVPADREFYDVDVGRGRPTTYSREEMEEASWTIELTIGEQGYE